MDWSSQHAGYVMAAYGLSFLVLAALLVHTLWQGRHRRGDDEGGP